MFTHLNVSEVCLCGHDACVWFRLAFSSICLLARCMTTRALCSRNHRLRPGFRNLYWRHLFNQISPISRSQNVGVIRVRQTKLSEFTNTTSRDLAALLTRFLEDVLLLRPKCFPRVHSKLVYRLSESRERLCAFGNCSVGWLSSAIPA